MHLSRHWIRLAGFLLASLLQTALLRGQDVLPPIIDNDFASRLAALEREVQAFNERLSISTTPTANAVPTSDDESHTPVVPDYRPSGSGNPEYPSVKLGGFFHADAAWFGQSPSNRTAIVNGDPLGDIQDGADFRRARLNAHGDLYPNIGYMMEMDFAFVGKPSFMDVYVELRDLPVVGNFRVGQWRQPFGMDALTSVKQLTFIERSLPFAFAPFRQIGVGIFDQAAGGDATWAVSAFRNPTDVYGGNLGDNGGYGMASRVTWLPWYDQPSRRLVHLGFDYSLLDPSTDNARFASPPEVFLSQSAPQTFPQLIAEPSFVDTGFVPAQNYQLYAAEFGASSGSLHTESEVVYATVNRPGLPSVNFSGACAQVGYFLTGEVRNYDRVGGVFDGVDPLSPFQPGGGWGAWEIAARYSYLDLNDRNVFGNRLDDVTFGVNWYLTGHAKFQFNYIHATLDDPASGDTTADIYAVRAQADF